MKKTFLALLLLQVASFAWTDLGVHGHLYKIQEENFYHMVKEAVKNIDPEEIKQKIIAEVKKQAVGHTDLPYAKEYSRVVEPNEFTLDMDIRNPAGRVIHKKGEKILIPNKVPIDICFIDGSNPVILKNQIDYFDAVVKKNSGPHASCVYMVSGADVLKLGEKYYPRDFYPTNHAFEAKFGLKYYPAYIHFKGNTRTIHYFPIEMFKHEVIKNEKAQ